MALATEATPHASTVIVRSIRSAANQEATRKTVRVRWVAGLGTKQPDQVTVAAFPGYRNGDAVGFRDTGGHQEAKLASPGVHDFTFAELDRDHPQVIAVFADGFYDGEVFVDSGDIEVEVILRHKF